MRETPARGTAASLRISMPTASEAALAAALRAYAGLWHNPAPLFGLAGLLMAAAISLAGRQEQALTVRA